MLKKLLGRSKEPETPSPDADLLNAKGGADVIEELDRVRKKGEAAPAGLLNKAGDMYRDLGQFGRAFEKYCESAGRYVEGEAWTAAEQLVRKAQKVCRDDAGRRTLLVLSLRLAMGRREVGEIERCLADLSDLLAPADSGEIGQIVKLVDDDLSAPAEAEIALAQLLAAKGRPARGTARLKIAVDRAEKQGKPQVAALARSRLQSAEAVVVDRGRREDPLAMPVHEPTGAPKQAEAQSPTDPDAAEVDRGAFDDLLDFDLDAPEAGDAADEPGGLPDESIEEGAGDDLLEPARGGAHAEADVRDVERAVQPFAELAEEARRGRTRIVAKDNREATGDTEEHVSDLLAQFDAGLADLIPADEAESYYELGISFLQMRAFHQAVKYFQTAYRSPDWRALAAEGLAEALLEQGNARLAHRVAKTVQQEADGDFGRNLGVAYWRARAAEAMGDTQEAAELYEEIAIFDMGYGDVAERLASL